MIFVTTTQRNLLTTRQASGRLRALLAKSGVDAQVTCLHGAGERTYSFTGDRAATAELFDELGIPTKGSEWTLYVTHSDVEANL